MKGGFQKMTKADLVGVIAKVAGITKDKAAKALDNIFDIRTLL